MRDEVRYFRLPDGGDAYLRRGLRGRKVFSGGPHPLLQSLIDKVNNRDESGFWDDAFAPNAVAELSLADIKDIVRPLRWKRGACFIPSL